MKFLGLRELPNTSLTGPVLGASSKKIFLGYKRHIEGVFYPKYPKSATAELQKNIKVRGTLVPRPREIIWVNVTWPRFSNVTF